jgi:hypothetical protein
MILYTSITPVGKIYGDAGHHNFENNKKIWGGVQITYPSSQTLSSDVFLMGGNGGLLSKDDYGSLMLPPRTPSFCSEKSIFHAFVGLKKTVTKLCVHIFPIQAASSLTHNYVCLN